MRKGILIIAPFLAACSTTPPSADPQPAHETPQVSEQFIPQAPVAEDVIYANLLLKGEQWQVSSIGSQRKPVDILKGEERLYIQTGKQVIMPDYDHHAYRDEDKHLFDCGQDLKYNKNTTYNPCASQFSSNIKFAEGWFGWTRRLDVAEVKKAIQQTDLLKRAEQEMLLVSQERQRCLDLRQQAEALAAKQQVVLRVVDETGMYKNGHEHIRYDLKIKPEVAKEGCEQDLAHVKMSYDMGIEQEFNLVLEMRGKTDWSKLDEDKLNLKRAIAEANNKLVPTLYITGKKVGHYNLYRNWSNPEIEFRWRTMDITETDLRQIFDVRNLSDSPVEIQQITFDINGHKVHRLNRIRLAPQESATGQEHASRYFVLEDQTRQQIEAIRVINSQTEQAEFGVTVTYRIKGDKKSLNLSDKVQLSSVL